MNALSTEPMSKVLSEVAKLLTKQKPVTSVTLRFLHKETWVRLRASRGGYYHVPHLRGHGLKDVVFCSFLMSFFSSFLSNNRESFSFNALLNKIPT